MSIDSPGNDPYVITVGATNTRETPYSSDDVMASYSSHGPTAIDHVLKPDLVAPGNLTISLNSRTGYLYLNYPSNAIDPAAFGSGDKQRQYFRMSGTSMSSAVVAGAAALMLEKSPGLTPDTVKARLMGSADKGVKNRDGTRASIFFQGAGSLNVRQAFDYTQQVSGYAWSPVTSRSIVPDLFLLDTSILGGLLNRLWSGSSIWNFASRVYGGNALWADAGLLGGSNALWADNPYDRRLFADDPAWGGNALWADAGHGPAMQTAIYGDQN
jgi:serine protease AprX